MRSPKMIFCLALVLLLSQTAGCYTWRRVPPGGMYDHYLSQSRRLRVETLDGWVGQIEEPSVREGRLVGRVSMGRELRAIPMDSIRTIQERKINWTRTGVILGAAGSAVYISLWIWLLQTDTYDYY